MRSGSYRRSNELAARKRRSIGTYSYGLLQLEYLEDRVLLAGTPTQLIWSQYPTSVAQGSPVFPAITLNIVDSTGAVVTTDTSRVQLVVVPGQSPLNGSMSGSTTLAAVGGVVNFTSVSFTQVGIYTIMAVDTTDGLQTLNSIQITVNQPAAKLALVTQPSNIVAGTPFALTVNVQDAAGNLVTTDHSSMTLTLSVSPTNASMSGTTVQTVVYPTGQATFNGLTLTVPGTYRLQIRDSQSSVATLLSDTFTVSAGAPAGLVFAQPPTDTLGANSPIVPAIKVNVVDVYNNIVTADNSAVILSINAGPQSAQLGGITTVQAVNGVATFNNVSLSQEGSYTLRVSDGSLNVAVSSSFKVTGTAVQLKFPVTPPAQSTVGTRVSPGISVMVQDHNGFTVPGDTTLVTLTVASGPGTMSGTTSVHAVNGVANFTDVSFSVMGTYTLSASADTLTSDTSPSFVVNGLPAQLAFLQQPGDGSSGAALAPAVTVQVEDSAGHLVVNASTSVTISVASFVGTGTGAVAGNVTVTAVNGIATFSNLILSPAGTFTLAAHSGTLTGAISNSFVISPSATQLVFATGPSGANTSSTMYPAIVINIENDVGQVVTSNTSTVTLAILSGPVGGTITGTASVAATAGKATFSNLTFTKVGNYTLLATDGNLATATSVRFTVGPGPTTLRFISQPTAVTAGQVLQPFRVFVYDLFKDLVTSDRTTITLTATRITSGNQTASGTITTGATATAVNGIATFTNLVFDAAGKYRLTATDSTTGVTTGVSKEFVVSPDASTGHLVISQSPSSTTVGRKFSTNLIVQIQDQYANVIKNSDPVVLTIQDPGTNGALTPGTVLNGTKKHQTSDGTAKFDNLSVSQAGTLTLVATDHDLSGTSSTASVQVIITPVLTTMNKPSLSSSYAVDKAFSLTTQMKGTLSSSAGWTGTADLVDAHGTVLSSNGTVSSNGKISIVVTGGLPAGTYSSARIRYSGDNNRTGGSTPAFTLVVGPSTTISLKASATNMQAGATLTLTATVKTSKSSAAARTGTLTLMDGTVTLGTLLLNSSSNSSGQFVLPGGSLAAPATGSHNYTVVYAGDHNFRGSTSSNVRVTVNSQTTTLELVPSATSITDGSTLTLTATVHTPNGSAPARTGVLTLMEGTLTLGSLTLGSGSGSSGVFTLPSGSIPAPGTGSHHYSVVYAGDAIFKASTSPTVTVTVTPTIVV